MGRCASWDTVPAYLGIIIVTVGLIGLPIQTSVNRELGILRRYRVTPLRPLTYIVADVTSYWVMALAGTVLLVVVGRLMYDVRFEGTVLSVLAGFTLSTLAFLAIGFVIASFAPSSSCGDSGSVSHCPIAGSRWPC